MRYLLLLLALVATLCCASLPLSAAAPQPAPAAAAPAPFEPLPPSGGRFRRADNQRHGSVDVTAQRDRGVGTSVRVQGQGDLWVSRNGNSRVTADGHYGQVVHGPARGQRDYGANVRFEHRF